MRLHMKQYRVIATAAALSLALAACGSAATTTPSTAASIAASSAASTAASTAASSPSTAAVASTAASSAASAAASAPTTSAAASTAAAATLAKLDLNTVTEEQLLATIPDFSNRMVREFMEYRPYVSIQQFRKEIGKYVSADQVTAWEQFVYVPVAVDTADAATLQQIPGVDATTADALIAARPYSTNDAFLAKLGELIGQDQAAAAQAYLAQ